MKIFFTVLLLLNLAVASAAKPMEITVPHNASTFQVQLKATPSTGYQWSVKQFDKTLVKLNGSEYQKPEQSMPGSSGNMIFTFSIIQNARIPASTSMQFSYARSWEPGSATIQNVRIIFEK